MCSGRRAVTATSHCASTVCHAGRPEADISLFTRLLFAAYFLEAGLILVIAPWSAFWDRNVFVETFPAIQQVLASPFTRGAVSGIGAVTMIAGLAELTSAFVSRYRREETPRQV